MKHWKKMHPLMKAGIIMIVLGLFFVIRGELQMSAPDRLIPKSGKWYSEELNMTMEFHPSHAVNVEVVKDGSTMQCRGVFKFHSTSFFIERDEEIDGKQYDEVLYDLYIKRKTKNKLTVVDRKSKEKYIFYLLPDEDG